MHAVGTGQAGVHRAAVAKSQSMAAPPARKVASGQLPWPTTTFVGRQHDLLAVGQWFADGHRLVVIVGPPGMGKTRVAVEVAAAMAARGDGRAGRVCDLTEGRDR